MEQQVIAPTPAVDAPVVAKTPPLQHLWQAADQTTGAATTVLWLSVGALCWPGGSRSSQDRPCALMHPAAFHNA